MAEVAAKESSKGKWGTRDKADHRLNQLCFFTISDFVEDRVRVRMLNVCAFALVYIFLVLSLLRTLPAITPQIAKLQFPSPPASFWMAGPIRPSDATTLPKRTQKIFATNVEGGPQKDEVVSVLIEDFKSNGAVACSLIDQKLRAGTLEEVRLKDVCNFDRLQHQSGMTNKLGLLELPEFQVDGPTGLYTFRAGVGSVQSQQDTKIMISTPVAYMAVVDPATPSVKVGAPVSARIRQPLEWQPAILLTDADGIPVPNRTVIAFANADPTWPPLGPKASPSPNVFRQGQKAAELECAESLPSDEQGIARFTCLGVKGANVDHVYFVFSESGFVFYPWNDQAYDPVSVYNFQVTKFRHPTQLLSPVNKVQITTPLSDIVEEGVPFSPQPQLLVTDENNQPVANARCYASLAGVMDRRFPQMYRSANKGVANKELLNVLAVTGSDGVARFTNLVTTVKGNTIDPAIPSYWLNVSTTVARAAVAFSCDGQMQDVSPWDPSSGGNIKHLQSRVSEIRIKRFIRKTARLTRFGIDYPPEDIFLAVVRVLDKNGNGVPGKNLNIQAYSLDGKQIGGAGVDVNTQEPTNDLGFAVVPFLMAVGTTSLIETGELDFAVKFISDNVYSEMSEGIKAFFEGGQDESACQFLHMYYGFSYNAAYTDVLSNSSATAKLELQPGGMLVMILRPIGQGINDCTYYPSLVNGSKPDMSNCEPLTDDSRRLQEVIKLRDYSDLSRIDKDMLFSGKAHARRLQDQDQSSPGPDGSIHFELQDMYNNDRDRWGRVEFQPDVILRTAVLDRPQDVNPGWPPLPSLRELSNKPGFFEAFVEVDGPAGDHMIQGAATFTTPEGKTQTCKTDLIPVIISEPIGGVEVTGDDGPENYFGKKIQAGGYIDFKVKLLDNGGGLPPTLELGNKSWQSDAVKFTFAEAPYQYLDAWGVSSTSWAEPLSNAAYELVPLQTANSDQFGYEASGERRGTLNVRFRFKQRGIFGKFAIQFHSFGFSSRPLTWVVEPPAGLQLKIVQEPSALGLPFVRSGDLIPQAPVVKIVEGPDETPVDGMILAYELLPESGRFTRLSSLPMYSPVPFMYSSPSGENGTAGLALFEAFIVIDGLGAARFKFLAGEGIETKAVPEEAMVIRTSFDYVITVKPPDSLPIGMPLQDVPGATLTVEAIPASCSSMKPDPDEPCEETFLSQYLGMFVARLVVTQEAGVDLTAEASIGRSLSALQDSTCVFVSWKEISGRCSDAVKLAGSVPKYQFSFQTVTWARVLRTPAKLQLGVTDLSMTLFDIGVGQPSDWNTYSAVEKTAMCLAYSQGIKNTMNARTTSEILGETEPARYSMVYEPPTMVEVGTMFLVRIKITTKSGGPVRGQAVRVGIRKATALSGTSMGGSALQSLASAGDNLNVVANGDVELDNSTIVRVSKKDGTVSFPLTIARATTGTFKLAFQPEIAGSKVTLETANFKVFNLIEGISGGTDAPKQIEVKEYGKNVRVPHKPSFTLTTADGSSLHKLADEGTAIRIRLKLKAKSTKVSNIAKIISEAKQEAIQTAKNTAKQEAERLKNAAGPLLQGAIEAGIRAMTSKAIGSFARFSEEFAGSCLTTGARMLQSGDPADARSIDSAEPEEAPASYSELLEEGPKDMVDEAFQPAEMMSQFTQVLTGGGMVMQSADHMKIVGEWDLTLDDMELHENSSYTIKRDLDFAFQPETDYAWTLAINGVRGKDTSFPAFKVELTPTDPVDVALSWFSSSLATVLTVVLLTTNTRKHHKAWFFFAILCTIALIVALPFLETYHGAMDGLWLPVALTNLGCIIVTLIWGLATELVPGIKTFDEHRQEIFRVYARRKTMQLLCPPQTVEPKLGLIGRLVRNMKRTFFRGFDAEEAFYFPSSLITSQLLCALSYGYVMIKAVDILNSIKGVLNKVVNKAIEAAVTTTGRVNDFYFKTTGVDLPDSATNYMYKQIDVVHGWFDTLIHSIEIGMYIGVTLASIIVILSIIGMFMNFRHQVLNIRKGKVTGFKVSDAKVAYAASFIGISISQTVVGFILITFLVTAITIPLTWHMLWKFIWRLMPTILSVFILPKVITIVGTMIAKKLLMADYDFRTRAGGSIFFFWQAVLAVPAGFVGALVRFVMGLLGVLTMLPIAFGANTPDLTNQLYLLDSTFRTYIATVMMHATHNNPIMIEAANRILTIKETRENWKGHWTSTRRILILILIRFPELRAQRKHVLQEKREMLALEKEMLKNPQVATEGKPPPSDVWVQHSLADARAKVVQASRTLEMARQYEKTIAHGGSGVDEAKRKLRDLLGNQARKEDTASANQV